MHSSTALPMHRQGLIFGGLPFGILLCAALPSGAQQSTSHLNASSEHELVGQLVLADAEISVKFRDQDGNGSFQDASDRFYLDTDQDGQFHPLRERYAAGRPFKVRSDPSQGMYAIAWKSDPPRAALVPINETGLLSASLSGISEEVTDVSFEALIASKSGMHHIVDSPNDKCELPAGAYRLESVELKAEGKKCWRFNFENLDKQAPYSIHVDPDRDARIDLLGKLELGWYPGSELYLSGKLSVQPYLKSETGLTLVRSQCGFRNATQDNSLVVSLLRSSDENEPSVVDVTRTGFACGQFCPTGLILPDFIIDDLLIELKFDAGPLGGTLRHREKASQHTQ